MSGGKLNAAQGKAYRSAEEAAPFPGRGRGSSNLPGNHEGRDDAGRGHGSSVGCNSLSQTRHQS
nr:MAG TPA: hypothetical protein [Caudoviricetes sp.]